MRTALAAAALVILAACEPVVAPRPPADPPMENACGAAGLQTLLGQPASVLETMRFANPVRVIRPGMAVTMDFNPARLNIEVDAAEEITRISCG